jgi:hypothetical protein
VRTDALAAYAWRRAHQPFPYQMVSNTETRWGSGVQQSPFV